MHRNFGLGPNSQDSRICPDWHIYVSCLLSLSALEVIRCYSALSTCNKLRLLWLTRFTRWFTQSAHPWAFSRKKNIKKESYISVTLWFSVVPTGIEPVTQGFSVLCSTNWAMAPFWGLGSRFPFLRCKVRNFLWTDQIFQWLFYNLFFGVIWTHV